MNIDKLIQLNENQNRLLKEYKKAIDISNYDYYVRCYNSKEIFVDGRLYELINVKTNELIKLDKLSRIKSYLHLRNITNVLFE